MTSTDGNRIYDILAESELLQERRQFHRIQINESVRLYYDWDTYGEFLGDISLQGARVYSYLKYPIGHVVDIGMPIPDSPVLRLKGIVARCQPTANRVFFEGGASYDRAASNVTPPKTIGTPREFVCQQCDRRGYSCYSSGGVRKLLSISASGNQESMLLDDTDVPCCPVCQIGMNPVTDVRLYELGVFFSDITLEQASRVNQSIEHFFDRSGQRSESRRARGRISGKSLQDSVECVFEDASSLHQGSVDNLSMGGFFAFSDIDLSVGQKVTISLGFIPMNRRHRSHATVVRKLSRDGDSGRFGYAVEFTRMDGELRADLNRFFYDIIRRDFGKFRDRHREFTGKGAFLNRIKYFAAPIVLGIVIIVVLLIFLPF